MQDYVGVHFLPCFLMCNTTLQNTLIGNGSVPLCIGIISSFVYGSREPNLSCMSPLRVGWL